jgi:TPR repeat protein
MMTRRVLSLMVVVCATLIVGAGIHLQSKFSDKEEAEQAVVLLKNGESRVAIDKLTRLAAGGNRPARYYLGLAYAFGLGVPPDAERAAYYLRGNSPEPDPEYFESISRSYEFGSGVARDDALAAKWHELAIRERNRQRR